MALSIVAPSSCLASRFCMLLVAMCALPANEQQPLRDAQSLETIAVQCVEF